MTKLSRKNTLVMGENDVWFMEGEEGPFDYSDGAETESYLRDVFSKVEDLSAQSTELKEAIYDWPSEYHLSPKRGNLFRAFDLNVFDSVLDIGSGCGAIARYLGEHINLVDAVEGAPVRADLARKRCRDLENVNIINANFNHLNLNEARYQLATLIGVVEYAGKFYPDAQTDREAAIGLLSNVATALDDDGVVMIAIENRLGAKYMLGAEEDHYHSPNEGIIGYPRKHGMCTYDLDEWRQLLAETDFTHHTVYGTFYDYKLPTLLIGEEYANDIQVTNHLGGYSPSLDVGTWCEGEARMVWRTMAQLGRLLEASNSFFIIAAKSQKGFEKLPLLDFAHLPGFSRKTDFSTVVKKLRNAKDVTRHPIFDSPIPEHALWQFEPQTEPFLHGVSLLVKWLDVFSLRGSLQESLELLAEYRTYIEKLDGEGALEIDALPQNILVNEGGYQLFDQEWRIKNYPIDGPLYEYVFFRALLYLAPFSSLLGDFYSRYNCRTHLQFIEEILMLFDISVGAHLDAFISLEEDFLEFVEGRNVSLGYLNNPIKDERKYDEAPWIWAHISLESEGQNSLSQRQRYELNSADFSIIDIVLDQQYPLNEGDVLSISPCDLRRPAGVGLFTLDIVTIEYSDGDFCEMDISEGELVDVLRVDNAGRMVYAIDGVAPTIKWKLNGVSGKSLKNIHIELMMRSSIEYWQIDQELMMERDQLKSEIAFLRRQITKPDLPLELVTAPLNHELPQDVRSKKERLKQKLMRLDKKVQPPPALAIPMDWRFMPPLDNELFATPLDGVTLLTESQPNKKTLTALGQLAKDYEVLVLAEPQINECIARAQFDWLLFLDSDSELCSFQLSTESQEIGEAKAFYGDARILHGGWEGVRREPQALKHSLLSGYSGIAALLLNPAAKQNILNSEIPSQGVGLAALVAIRNILDGIGLEHCGSVVSQSYYTAFVWPPTQAHVEAKQRADQMIEQSVFNCHVQNKFEVNGLSAVQFSGQEDSEPMVSIVIPFKDNPALLENCIRKIVECTWYKNYEIIGVNNASMMKYTLEVMAKLETNFPNVHFTTLNQEFNFSKLVNHGVRQAKGEFVVLMNNDVLVETPDWISYLLGPFIVDRQCAVTGACLNYPEGIVQSCGIAIGEEGLPVNVGQNLMANDKALFGRLYASRDVLAVSAALMMVRLSVFEELGGFDAEHFAIAFNDADYCVRAKKAGYDVVVVGNANAFHYESYSRLSDLVYGDKYQRFRKEQEAFRKIHADIVATSDPYHPEIERTR